MCYWYSLGLVFQCWVGDNSILQKATTAKENTDNAQIKEKIQLAELSARAVENGNLFYSSFKTELSKEFGKEGVDWNISEELTTPWAVTVGNVRYETTGTTQAIELPDGWNINAIQSAYPNNNAAQKAPIPKGFVVSEATNENTIEGGLVIYEGTTPVNDDNVEKAMISRNQYVWIPVNNINNMIMCKSNTSGSICNIELINEELKCTNENHSVTSTDLCGRLYERSDTHIKVDGQWEYTTNMNFNSNTQTWDSTGYHEPDAASDIEQDSSESGISEIKSILNNENLANSTSYDEIKSYWEKELINDNFMIMAKSVAKYGGFYVSRYELSDNGSSKKNQTIVTSSSSSEKKWYDLYKECKKYNTGDLKSVMIWGCQYDQIINFIGEESQKFHKNLIPQTFVLSGNHEYDIMNNIYDLESNYQEWTAETWSNAARVRRGDDGSINYLPASWAGGYDPNFSSYNRIYYS